MGIFLLSFELVGMNWMLINKDFNVFIWFLSIMPWNVVLHISNGNAWQMQFFFKIRTTCNYTKLKWLTFMNLITIYLLGWNGEEQYIRLRISNIWSKANMAHAQTVMSLNQYSSRRCTGIIILCMLVLLKVPPIRELAWRNYLLLCRRQKGRISRELLEYCKHGSTSWQRLAVYGIEMTVVKTCVSLHNMIIDYESEHDEDSGCIAHEQYYAPQHPFTIVPREIGQLPETRADMVITAMQSSDTHHHLLQYDLMIEMFDRWQEENRTEDDH